MKVVKGDLIKLALEGEFDVIVHGCNCFHTMGAGIAKQIKETFPEAYETDCKTSYGDKIKLGEISSVKIEDVIIVNAYTQFDHKGNKDVNYTAIRHSFRKIKEKFTGLKIGYPCIGAGLAGGDWNKITRIIDFELKDEDHTVVIFENN